MVLSSPTACSDSPSPYISLLTLYSLGDIYPLRKDFLADVSLFNICFHTHTCFPVCRHVHGDTSVGRRSRYIPTIFNRLFARADVHISNRWTRQCVYSDNSWSCTVDNIEWTGRYVCTLYNMNLNRHMQPRQSVL
jgi:hypothetical protein